MQKSFEYLHVTKAMDSIDVADIGNVCLNVLNDIGEEWYLIIQTEAGISKVQTFGPFMVDLNSVSKGQFNYNYFSKGYNEKTLISTIERFLTDPKRNITQAFEINAEEAEQRLIDLFQEEYLQ